MNKSIYLIAFLPLMISCNNDMKYQFKISEVDISNKENKDGGYFKLKEYFVRYAEFKSNSKEKDKIIYKDTDIDMEEVNLIRKLMSSNYSKKDKDTYFKKIYTHSKYENILSRCYPLKNMINKEVEQKTKKELKIESEQKIKKFSNKVTSFSFTNSDNINNKYLNGGFNPEIKITSKMTNNALSMNGIYKIKHHPDNDTINNSFIMDYLTDSLYDKNNNNVFTCTPPTNLTFQLNQKIIKINSTDKNKYKKLKEFFSFSDEYYMSESSFTGETKNLVNKVKGYEKEYLYGVPITVKINFEKDHRKIMNHNVNLAEIIYDKFSSKDVKKGIKKYMDKYKSNIITKDLKEEIDNAIKDDKETSEKTFYLTYWNYKNKKFIVSTRYNYDYDLNYKIFNKKIIDKNKNKKEMEGLNDKDKMKELNRILSTKKTQEYKQEAKKKFYTSYPHLDIEAKRKREEEANKRERERERKSREERRKKRELEAQQRENEKLLREAKEKEARM